MRYTVFMPDAKENYRLYMGNALEMLQVASENLNNDHYSSACNRAYYACFYAASALLYSKGLSFGKHSAVLAAFRQHFVKTGEFDAKWSKIYEVVMSSRQIGDYEINLRIEKEQASSMLSEARAFVEEVEAWLHMRNLI